LGFWSYQLAIKFDGEQLRIQEGAGKSGCPYLGGIVCSGSGTLQVLDLVLDLVNKSAPTADLLWGQAVAGRVCLNSRDRVIEVVEVGQVVEDGVEVLAGVCQLGRRGGVGRSVSDARVRGEEGSRLAELAQDVPGTQSAISGGSRRRG
jgi:hypothetical protein